MTHERVDCVVIGAGVVGLAAARALALAGRDVVVIEAAEAIGTVTSSRNSEVIHAGIYYPTGSLKHRFCLHGKRRLYEYCDAHGVPYSRCGKLIVATNEDEERTLDRIEGKAEENGVEEMRRLSGSEAVSMEPELACTGALWSGSTGIISSHDLMVAYRGDAEDEGAMIAFNSPILKGWVEEDGIVLDVGGDHPMRLKASTVVNAAGLGAQPLSLRIDGVPTESIPPLHYAKGNYYSLVGRSPFSTLIYPVPVPGGLGVHLTLDIGGQARFGPDVEWVEEIEYSVDPKRAGGFYEAVRKYWPGLADGGLIPGYAGIRPKVARPGGSGEDFIIEGPSDHGVPGYVALYGMESPGLTGSLAIGDYVVEKSEG